MSSDFSLDTKKMAILWAGCGVVGLLIFAAGLLVGFRAGWSNGSPPTKSPPARMAVLEAPEAPPPSPPRQPPVPPDYATKPPRRAPQAEVAPPRPESTVEEPPGQPEVVPTPPPERPRARQWTFTVQVGAFRAEKNATTLIGVLHGKGYTPYMFRVQDAQKRLWYTVRMGDYVDRARASQAATDFTQKEDMSAIVRRIGAL